MPAVHPLVLEQSDVLPCAEARGEGQGHSNCFFFSSGMPLEEVLPIPLYLSEVTFCPVLGLKGRGITDGGKAQMDRMLHPLAVAHIDFSRNHSDRGNLVSSLVL